MVLELNLIFMFSFHFHRYPYKEASSIAISVAKEFPDAFKEVDQPFASLNYYLNVSFIQHISLAVVLILWCVCVAFIYFIFSLEMLFHVLQPVTWDLIN